MPSFEMCTFTLSGIDYYNKADSLILEVEREIVYSSMKWHIPVKINCTYSMFMAEFANEHRGYSEYLLILLSRLQLKQFNL
jgi:hypothetical protein